MPMVELVRNLEAIQFKNVKTYIQSGNVVFDSNLGKAKLVENAIAKQIESKHGFCPQIFLLSVDELQHAIKSNPFPDAVSDPKSLHFFFLKESSKKPNVEALESAKAKTEGFVLTKNVFYLYAPDGIGRSKLASSVEKHLGVIVTARNLRTVQKLFELASQS